MDLEPLLLQTLSKGQLEELLAERIAQFHGLLTREIAMKLIAKEKGLLKEEEKKAKLAEIQAGEKRLVIEAKVKKVWQLAEYKSGKKSRVVELEDETGTKPLVLWNGDVSLGARLKTRDTVLVKGAYERNGELHLGYSGAVDILQREGFTDLSALKENEYAHIKGYVTKAGGYDRFVDGTTTKVAFLIHISDGKTETQALIWGKPERGRSLAPGDEIILENALVKKGRLELSEEGRIFSRRKERVLLGKVERMEPQGNGISVTVGGRQAVFDRENALRFMGMELAQDIALGTALNLKKDYLLNTNVALRIKEEGGKVIVER